MVVVILVAACVAAYWNSFGGVFLFDDEFHIEKPRIIRQLFPPWDLIVGRRRPILDISLAINYAISGLETWSYHLVNMITHGIAGLALFGVIRRTLLLDRIAPRFMGREIWIAGASALLWIVHPLQTQSVTYIIQRSESLMGMFFLLSLYSFIRGTTGSGRGWCFLAILSCAMGAGAKPVMVVAPVLILLYDRTFLTGSFSESLRRRPLVHAGLFATWILFVFMGVLGNVVSPDPEAHITVGFGLNGTTPFEYFRSQFGVILHYLKLSFWPSSLCLDHNWQIATTLSDILPGALVIGGLTGLTAWALWKRPALGFIGAWFFLILAPTSSFVPIKDIAFEHRMYLSLAAVILMVVLAVDAAMQRWGNGDSARGRRQIATIALVSVATLALTTRTIVRNQDYHNEVHMWETAVTQRPGNPRAHENLSAALIGEKRYEEGIETGKIALNIDPKRSILHCNLGTAYAKIGQVDKAMYHTEMSIKYNPDNVLALGNLGIGYMSRGRYDEAEAPLRRAIELDPYFAIAYRNLGGLMLHRGHKQRALKHLKRAAELDPDDETTFFNLAVAYTATGEISKARAAIKRAAELAPDDVNIKGLYQQLRDAK